MEISIPEETLTRPHWVSAWYAAPTQMLPANLSGRTLRQTFHIYAGGERVRLHLSNRYGEAPVTLRSISLGPVLSGPMLQPGEQTILFGGAAEVTLAPGQEVVSDPVALPVQALSKLAVTFFLAQGEIMTGHLCALHTSYVSGLGDYSSLPAEAAFLLYPLLTTSWWLVSGIDVLSPTPLNAVVALGSSVTDGFGSTLDAQRSWPDYLARRLREAGGTRTMSVINAGISGNQLTASQLPQMAESGLPRFIFGEAGNQRLAWDVMQRAGATDLIVHIGSNDLRGDVSATTLIEAFQEIVRQARTSYQRVFGTTILPGGYLPAQEAQRQIINAWMLEQGPQLFDAVFDFATPLRSSQDASLIDRAYDSGDGVHPNDEGYRLMANAVDLSKLTGSLS